MKEKRIIQKVALSRLEAKAVAAKKHVPLPPPQGWIREIRQALGMSARQLAARAGISQATLSKIEKGEVERTVTVKTLDRIAEALDCQLIYFIVPRSSFGSLIKKRARRTAERLVGRVSHSMDLEKQGLSAKRRKSRVDDLAGELERNLSKEIWERWE